MIRKPCFFIMPIILFFSVFAGCGALPEYEEVSAPAEGEITKIDESMLEMVPLTGKPAAFSIPYPSAPGTKAEKNNKAEIDISNSSDGYFMARWLISTSNALRLVVKCPGGISYTYMLRSDGTYEIYPLSGGNGAYQITVYENAGADMYAKILAVDADFTLKDEFAPFLRPNQYVDYTKDSLAARKAEELAKSASNMTDIISSVYNYAINNITYDKELAASVKYGYCPDIDKVLKTGKGICFDYAALMTAMLRSRGIPSKLVVGYTGDIYHSWISVYSEETGWINSVIYFDGMNWKLMDPTFASSGSQSDDIMKYIGDGKNYKEKYLY